MLTRRWKGFMGDLLVGCWGGSIPYCAIFQYHTGGYCYLQAFVIWSIPFLTIDKVLSMRFVCIIFSGV